MAQSLSTFDAALKDDYSVGLKSALNNANVVLALATRNTRDIVGRRAVWATHVSRSSGTGSRAELAALPSAGFQGFEDPSERLRFHYHTIKVSGPAIALTKNDRGAFARALEVEMNSAERDLKNNLSRQVVAGQVTVQTGSENVARTGRLARLESGSGNTVLAVDADTTEAEMRFFFVSQRVDVITTSSGAVLAANREVTAIDRAAGTITVDGANITRVTGDIVVVSGSYNVEFGGLPYLINDAEGDKVNGTNTVAVHGLRSDQVPAWASTRVGGSTEPISEDLLMQMWEGIENDGDGNSAAARLLVGSAPQSRTLANKLAAQRRYDGKLTEIATGWTGLDVSKGVFVSDKYALDNDLFLINTNELQYFVGEDVHFDQVDGKALFKALDGTDAYEARIKAYTVLAATNRNSHARASVQPVS